MHWQLWAAFLLLAWQSAPNQIQAARTNDFNVRQHWKTQVQKNSGSQIIYPRYQFIQSRYPSDGLKRNHNLAGQAKAAPSTTTERPFLRVWNSFLRSVQPNFGLQNLTNPLVNLFNNGNTNIVETLPVQAVYTDEHEDELQQQQSSTSGTQSANKRKRKRRKQQKRRPVYDSQEQDDPYDYYGAPLTVSLPQHQPMFYYGPSDYYGMRRLQHYNQPNYYDQYFEDNLQAEGDAQDAAEESLGELNAKKYTVLRPISLAIKLPSEELSAETILDESNDDNLANEDEDENYGVDTEGGVGSAATDATNDDHELSESMRNALGAYMRDDHRNRQRQRQSDTHKEMGAPAKVKPRKHQRYLLAARLVKNHQ
ncbi:uncharacterized protein [Drosophila virilis]|uniref:Uncharacterized protein n=1 Tax=Drosophila virilis TaxID=7244 RepID=B4LWL4_DROVI|nr:uncharacterized protein Dvir_GJ24283 [Drosophila virilis]